MRVRADRQRTWTVRGAGWTLACLLVGVTASPSYAASIREQQWHLDAMRADEMWQVSTGQGVTVAVIDSGVDPTLADLRGQVLEGKSFSHQEGGAHADNPGHGTSMAAIIAATGKRTGGNGSFGLAPGAKILPLRVADWELAKNDVEGSKSFLTELSAAIRYAADTDAKILNISMGQDSESQELVDAVRYAVAKGKLIFAAVGNRGDKDNTAQYPSATAGVIGVAATGRDNKSTAESVHGPQVDLAAPGDEIVSACGGDTELCKTHGTSDATALASASAALIWSAHPDWTANQVTRVLINTAGGPRSGKERTDYIGYGVVRPRIALKDPGDPGPADVNPLPEPGLLGAGAPQPSATKATGGMPPRGKNADDDDTLMWIGIGGAATAAVVIPLVVIRRRRP
ncbi:type VII secretion-associated serine protease mycosin [Streptomyces stramineus]|uniref:Type VII secretion-associated serine protease mycosin n=2 Tax=Streptomyces TaxID=1883 RepID=A0ABP3KTD7_9ACTN